MTVWPNGTIVSRQVGTIIANINDAPYTLSQSLYSPGIDGFLFNANSWWPCITNLNFSQPALQQYLKKLNAAILEIQAPTIVSIGVQNGLAGQISVSNGSVLQKYAPCYYGGFLAGGFNDLVLSTDQVLTYSIAAPLTVGSTTFPAQIIGPDNNSVGSQTSSPFVVRYGNGWAFCLTTPNLSPAYTQQRYYLFSPSGAPITQIQSITGPYPGPDGTGTMGNGYYQLLAPYSAGVSLTYGDVHNIMLSPVRNDSQLRPLLWFLDKDFNVSFARNVTLDDPAAAAKFNQAGSNQGNQFWQVTPAGWLVTLNTPYNIHGFNQAFTCFLIGFDGASWAPVIINLVGPNARKTGALNYGDSITIDPNGTLWLAKFSALFSSTQYYVGNTFGVDLQLPLIPPINNINLPQFTLPCFTPCDSQAIVP